LRIVRHAVHAPDSIIRPGACDARPASLPLGTGTKFNGDTYPVWVPTASAGVTSIACSSRKAPARPVWEKPGSV